jgi:SAM-dependent methyltransferase
MSQLEFDKSTARQLEVLYGTRDVLRRRQLVRDALGVSPGNASWTSGCGPGFYVAELLEHVGSGGLVVGIDSSPPMLTLAAHRSKGHDNVAFHEANATSLPVDTASFDAALSVQMLEYVADVPAALAELHRALRIGGRLLVWDVDWATVSLHTANPARTQRILRSWDGHLAHPSLPQTLTSQLRRAGFEDVKLEGHTFTTNRFDPETHGGYLVPFIARFAVGRDGISEDEVNAWEAEQRELAQSSEFFSPASSSASPRRAAASNLTDSARRFARDTRALVGDRSGSVV